MIEKELSIKNRNKLLAAKIVKNLQSRKFEACYVETAEEASEKVLSLISEKVSVSWGGSTTLEEIGVLDKIRNGNYKAIDRDTAKSPEERHELMHQAFGADVYLTSFNAISEDGVLINIDSVGNRVAAIAYGPKNVIAVISMNKVCKTVENAIERARNYAAPVNAQRCNLNPHFPPIENTPCILNGSCGNCKAQDCICSYIVETRMCKIPGRIKIILVGEELGV